jgi:hypothetical protein
VEASTKWDCRRLVFNLESKKNVILQENFSLQDFMGSSFFQRPLLGCNSLSFQGKHAHIQHEKLF